MILLVPVLDFVASEIPAAHRLSKCWPPNSIHPCRVHNSHHHHVPFSHPKSRSPPSPSFSLASFLLLMLLSYSPQLDLCTDAAKLAVSLQSIQSFVASAHELRATVRNSSPSQLQRHARKVGSFPLLV